MGERSKVKIATVLFTYHRSYHTERVLSALKSNTVLPEKLFIFQDGLKPDEDEEEWNKVNKLIQDVDWCDRKIMISECNKGLAASIAAGIDYVFNWYDAAIVLEDDCVAAPGFMRYMEQCLKKYENHEAVYSVSGYSWPVALEKDQYDVYGCGRISSLGWGTWKDRWARYKKDVDMIKRMKADQDKSRQLATWGRDLEEMLYGTIAGRCDSWAVYWALNVIDNKGICINPYISLIKHIGWDGTGTNTPKMDMDDITLEDRTGTFILPDHIEVLDTTRRALAKLFGNSTALTSADVEKDNVLVYGVGNFYLQNEDAVNQMYNIQAFVDRKKQGWFAGKKIIAVDKIAQYQYDKILVMVLNIQECFNIIKSLTKYGINAEQIILGIDIYGSYKNGIEKISVQSDGNGIKLMLSIRGMTIGICSEDEFYNVYDALVNQVWNYAVSNGKRDVVLDVGMNIGDTVLYFLNKKSVKKVYGYEPFQKAYSDAMENLHDYLKFPDKVEIFQYGVSDKNDERLMAFNRDMSCGQSTIADIRKKNYEWYRNAGLVQSAYEEEEWIQIRDAAEVFRPIIQDNADCNMVLKMNCEGEEYHIMERLAATGLIKQFSVVMLEWHYRGREPILKYLDEAGFAYWFCDKERNMGLIYAFKA